MKLFRRLLLALFPLEFIANAQHPVSMFISFISPKQFFSVIHRKIAENFKLNLFDICLDPFEVKIGFGEEPTLQVKEIDQYYAYGCVAQMNGRTFYSCSNLSIPVSMIVAMKLREVFSQRGYNYGYYFLVAVYLLSFVFIARLRVFPEGDPKVRYQWFVDTIFSFYELVLRQNGILVDEEALASFRSASLQHLQLFFFLFYFYQKLNQLFYSPTIADKEFYTRLFFDDMKGKKNKGTIETFLQHRSSIVTQTTFSDKDIPLFKLVFPADIQIKYLFQGRQWQAVIDWLLPKLYEEEIIDQYLTSFLKNEDKLDEFLQRLVDAKHFQQHYFEGTKEVSQHQFRLGADYETAQEIDSFISSLESGKIPNEAKIPERLKQESIMMDKLMNFYVTYLGGLGIGRGDSFGLRFFSKRLVKELIAACSEKTLRQDALQYYGWLLYTYSKNVFYYTYAYEHIRAGKEVIRLPYASNHKEVYSNFYLLKLFDEHFFYTILQDINESALVISVTQPDVVAMFRNLLGEDIRILVDATDTQLIDQVYGGMIQSVQSSQEVRAILHTQISRTQIQHLREHLYTVDLHVRIHASGLLAQTSSRAEAYGNMATIGILATLRETLFGILLYITYLQLQAREKNKDYAVHTIKCFYILDVLQIWQKHLSFFLEVLDTLLVTYHTLLELRIKLDDNLNYLSLGTDNRYQFIEKKTHDQLLAEASGDDIVRFRDFLKTISYYNKRIVRPK